MKLYTHQGDIPIFEAECNLNMKESQRVVVAEGETTGHKHVVVANKGARLMFARDDKGTYIKIMNGGATIVHEEHKTIQIPDGSFYFSQQSEYDPLVYRRQVMD